MSGKYAQGTSVPVERSEAEVKKILMKYGADQMSSGWTSDKAVLMFRIKNRMVRIDMPLAIRGLTVNNYGYKMNETQAAAENRRRWRALVLYVKAKLESVETGIVSIEQAFLAHILLPNKQTVAEFMQPQIESAYERGDMPKALPGY